MNTLLVLDDLGPLTKSKNRLIQTILPVYMTYLRALVHYHMHRLMEKADEKIFIAGPRELSQRVSFHTCEYLDYEHFVDQVDWRKAGRMSTAAADKWQTSPWPRQCCPFLFTGKASVPKIAFVRLSHLFCYDPAVHYFLILQLIRQFSIQKIVTLGNGAEIEKIALSVGNSLGLKTSVLSEGDPWLRLKSFFDYFVYYRDRKRHAAAVVTKKMPARRASLTSQERKIICLIPAHSLHLKVLIPLAKAINQSSQFSACALLHESFSAHQHELDKEGISFFWISDFGQSGIQKEFRRNKKKLRLSWQALIKTETFRKEMTADGISWFDILKNKIRWFFFWSFNEILILKIRFKAAFQKLHPAGIFVFSDARFAESTAAAAAKERKIPVFFYSPNTVTALDRINRYDTGDYLFVTGPVIRKRLLEERLIPEGRLVEAGDIRFDGMAHWNNKQVQQETRETLRIPVDKSVFLLISWYTNLKFTDAEKKFFFQTAWQAVKKRQDACLVVKAHPNENEGKLLRFTKSLGMTCPIVKNMPLYALFSISKAIMTIASMASLEAMMFDIPVISVDIPGRDYDYYIPLKKEKGAIPVKDSREMESVVDKLLNDQSYVENQISRGNQFVSKYILKTPEGAGKRILNRIEQISENPKARRTVALIQARLSSTRLPGKALLDLSGKSVLQHVIERVCLSEEIDCVVVVTSRQREDDAIVRLCRQLDTAVYRGSLNHVLERYCRAAEDFEADIIVRITADSPLVEPKWIDRAVRKLKCEGLDYVNAKSPEFFPVGMGNEVITKEALAVCFRQGVRAEDKEHVTWYCLSHPNQFKIGTLGQDEGEKALSIRVALDEPADYELLKTIFQRLYPKNPYFGCDDLARLHAEEPELFQVNASVRENPNLYDSSTQ